jgi:hypothetical protein
MLTLLMLLAAPQPAAAAPNWTIHCDYAFMGAPMSSVDLETLPDGRFGPAARISIQGATHLESYSEEAPAPGELAHGWISKESPENRIELVIYREPTPQGRSKLVNHQVPFGQEVWGGCRGV